MLLRHITGRMSPAVAWPEAGAKHGNCTATCSFFHLSSEYHWSIDIRNANHLSILGWRHSDITSASTNENPATGDHLHAVVHHSVSLIFTTRRFTTPHHHHRWLNSTVPPGREYMGGVSHPLWYLGLLASSRHWDDWWGGERPTDHLPHEGILLSHRNYRWILQIGLHSLAAIPHNTVFFLSLFFTSCVLK